MGERGRLWKASVKAGKGVRRGWAKVKGWKVEVGKGKAWVYRV